MTTENPSVGPRERMRNEFLNLCNKHGFDHVSHLRSYDVSVAAITELIVGPKTPDFVAETQSLVRVWISRGQLYYARILSRAIAASDKEVYELARKRSGRYFGADYDEYLLACDYGTDEEINRSIRTCSEAKFWYEYPHGKVEQCLLSISASMRTMYGNRFGAHRAEYSVMQSLIPNYDTIVGIAHSGVSSALVASALGHPNVGIIDYHHGDGQELVHPLWIREADMKHSKKVLLCENDAVSGMTLSAVTEHLMQKSTVKLFDVLFTGTFYGQSRNVVQRIPTINQVFHATELIPHDAFTKIVEVRDAFQRVLHSKPV